LTADVESLRASPQFRPAFCETPSLSTAILALNTRRGPLADSSLRRRIRRSLDAPGIVERTTMRLTTPATTLTPPGLLGVDVSRQAEHVDDAPVDPGEPVELTVAMSPAFDVRGRPITNEVFAALRAAGFTVRELGVWTAGPDDVHRTGDADAILMT